ncbi:MAG: YihY/virulence factor BrkB family protein [Haloquadratum sp.]
MSVSLRDRLAVPYSIVAALREREVTFLAAALAYYALVSLVPLLTLAVVAAAALGGETLATEVRALTGQYLLPAGADLVSRTLEDRTSQGTVSALSLLVTAWGSLKLFRGIDVAFSRIYDYPASSLFDQLADGAVTLATLGGAAIAVAAVSAVIAVVDLPFVGVGSTLLLLGILTAAFLPLYSVIPDVPVSPRQALPGALFAAIGWSLLGAGFGVYVQFAKGAAGALGGLLLLVTWFYFSGVLVLAGAVVNAVIAGRADVRSHLRLPSHRRGERDRQVQHPRDRRAERTMSAEDATDDDATRAGTGEREETDERAGPGDAGDRDDTEVTPRGAPDIEELDQRVESIRADLDAFEAEVESRTVDRPAVESDLRRYVRRRLRGGKARGWGPYLVLFYGTAATIAAFYFLEDDLLAVVAMLVIYLSTLGLYLLFVIFGVGLNALGVPGRLLDWLRDRRS